MPVKLKKFFSYKHVRKKTKVERAICLANTIDRQTDPLRHLYLTPTPKSDDKNLNIVQ